MTFLAHSDTPLPLAAFSFAANSDGAEGIISAYSPKHFVFQFSQIRPA